MSRKKRKVADLQIDYSDVPEYFDVLTEPSVIVADLPDKFHGSQSAAKRYADAYHWANKNVAQKRDKVAGKLLPYVIGLSAGPAGFIGALAGESINSGISGVTKGRKDSWGDVFVDEQSHPKLNSLLDLTNPGYMVAGPLESGLQNRLISPSVGNRLAERYGTTSRVKSALERLGKQEMNGELYDAMEGFTDSLRERLLKEGVDADLLTDDNLRLLMKGRATAIMDEAKNGVGGRYAMRTPPYEGVQHYVAFENGYPAVKKGWPDNGIGVIGVEQTEYGLPGVQYLENTMRGASNYPKYVSETLYNAAIKDRGSLVSGKWLLNPDVTVNKIWPKYSNKRFIDKSGYWDRGVGKEGGHDVYELLSPTYDVPIKYADDFSARSISPDGTFLVDWSRGPEFSSGGSIHIKPSKRGTFTAAAKKHGKSVQAFASQVLAHKENYSPAMVKKANFARNASKWHEDGGFLQQYPDGGRIKGKNNGKYFVTELNDRREKKFQYWYANAASILGLDPNPDAYSHAYDYRGYWLNNRGADVSSPDFHFPDTWKQPHHPTFSDESIYAKGHEGVGHWEGDTFVPGPFNRLMQATEPTAFTASVAPISYGNNYVPSEDILNYIKDTEDFRDQWYQDGNGIWTIGYGFTGDDVRKRYPNGMTRAEADQYFADSVKTRIPMFVGATPNFDRLNQNQRDALFSYYYNIGHGGYTRKSPAMQEALKNFDLDTVVNNIDFGYNDKKNRGLRKRRDYERKLFGTPMDYGGILDRLRNVYGDNDSIKAAILRAKNVKK